MAKDCSMMGRRTFGAIVMGGVTALLSGCNPFAPRAYRYKMTIEVATKDGVKAFSSVRAISYSMNFSGGYAAAAKGEAVIMDLPGGPVFALLSGADGDVEYAASIAEAALVSEIKPGGANLDYRAGVFAEIYPTKPDIRSYMPKDPLPMLVTFRDIADPKSVEKVDPTDLAAAFGPGVKLRRITVAVTDEAVTSGIGERLGWLGVQRGSLIPATLQSSVEIKQLSSVTEAAFIQGNSQ